MKNRKRPTKKNKENKKQKKNCDTHMCIISKSKQSTICGANSFVCCTYKYIHTVYTQVHNIFIYTLSLLFLCFFSFSYLVFAWIAWRNNVLWTSVTKVLPCGCICVWEARYECLYKRYFSSCYLLLLVLKLIFFFVNLIFTLFARGG